MQLTKYALAGSSCASLYDILEGGMGVEVMDETKETPAEVVEEDGEEQDVPPLTPTATMMKAEVASALAEAAAAAAL